MATIPPPYSSRDHAQVQPGPQSITTSPTQEFSESTAVTLEWTITGAKAMYEATRGEQKSKCVKSAVFGDVDNCWELLFYANSGQSAQAGDHVSLYLSCVPTPQERGSKLAHQWHRKGLWWFKFEIRSGHPKPETIVTKEASDHTFAVKIANWGWVSYLKRDALFLHPQVLASDTFQILCTIRAQPQPPAGFWLGVGLQPSSPVKADGRGGGSGGGLSQWASQSGCAGVAGGTTAGGGSRRVVPKELVMGLGSMLDDPLYSDVEFIIPSRDGPPKNIYAIKKLLCRYDYFEALLNGGFGEDEGLVDEEVSTNGFTRDSRLIQKQIVGDDDLDMLSDSDIGDEHDPYGDEEPEDEEALSPHLNPTTASQRSSSPPQPAHNQSTSSDVVNCQEKVDDLKDTMATIPGGLGQSLKDHKLQDDLQEDEHREENQAVRSKSLPKADVAGPKKTKVIIRDAAWTTWWALLYWIYTDIIYFAPLTSTFENSHKSCTPTSATTTTDEPTNRLEWLRRWMADHDIDPPPSPSSTFGEPSYELHVGPRPVSAKSIYRLADKLDILPLKLRAYHHICSQLTANNVPAEVFSRFSATFEDVRKVQVECFLANWGEIKKSDVMMDIWKNIRLGKHVGFEDVWPLIVKQLDFKPS
ncbi:hypothetical protein I350_05990 [Cryptococcus amylolentus CBS 6273]|uniref:MATH domain-containing protein n=1 Tax=Cryptococcus amylolentus CBS 6273 TaxID=1296118 RepID=A0A1E3JQM2_9TREE|nr:hypothetical protein I350_05990 [Cryptococcus amylolentus CBS 6273]